MRKRIISIVLTVCIMLAMLPTAAVTANAESYKQTYTGTGTSTLSLSSGTFLLDNYTINNAFNAIYITGDVTLVIKGTVTLTALDSCAGIYLPFGTNLTIRGYEGTSNKLIVRGGNATSGGNGGNGGNGNSSRGGYGGGGGVGGIGGGAAIGSDGGRPNSLPAYNRCYPGSNIGTVNIDNANLAVDLQGGAGGYGGAGGGGGDTSDPGKSGGGGGGGGGGGFPGPAIGQGGANGMCGGNGGDGVSVSGIYGSVGGGGGGAAGYGYCNGGGGNGGRGACYNWSGTNWMKSGFFSTTVIPTYSGYPTTAEDDSLEAYIDGGCYAYPGQGGSAVLINHMINRGSGGKAAGTVGGSGQSLYVYDFTTTSYNTICFNANGGSANNYSMTIGNTVGTMPSSNPTRDGYTFKGWNTKADGKGSTVTATTALLYTTNTYYAVWEKNTYNSTITVYKNGSVLTTAPNDTVVLSTSSESAQTGKIATTPSNGVFTFSGIDNAAVMYIWAKNKAGVYKWVGFVSNTATDCAVHYYDVTLTAGTGIQSVSGSGIYLAGETATISAAPAQGYNWSKWSDGNTTMTGRNITVSGKTDLTANATIIPIYTISADKTTLDFGSLASGYTQPSAVTVTITNTGNQSVTLTQPTSTNYIIGNLSKVALSAGETATFTIQPKANLAYGNHDESITVSTNYGTSAAASAKFSVLDNTVPTATISIGSNSWNSFLNTVTFGLFFKETKTVTITANDIESGIKTIEYLLSATKFDSTNAVAGTWTDITSAKQFNINPNSKQYIYVRVTDNDGNVSIINTDGVILYTDSSQTAPGITFTKNGTADESTQVTLNGNTVKEIKNGSNVIASSDYTVDINGTITFKASYLNTLAVNSYTLTVSYNPMGETYKDTAGNVAPGTTNISLTVQRADGEVKNISIIGKTYDGNAVSAPTYNKLGTGTATIEYKVKDAADSTYTTTAPKNAGDYTVRVTVATDDTYKETSGTANFTIAQKEVTITDATVDDTKVYDGNTTAKIKNTGMISDNYDGDNLTIKAGTAAYATKGVAQNKTVTFTGFALSGSNSANYILSAQPASVQATITPKPITISGITANNKIYDGNKNATLVMPTVTPAMGVVTGDTITVNASGLFEDKDAGSNKTVNISGITLGGADVGNYILAATGNQLTATASINRKAIVVTPDAISKNVGQNDPALSYTCSKPVTGESASFSGALSRSPGETAGNYPVGLGTLSLMNNGAFLKSNYSFELSPETVNFTIHNVVATASDYEVTGNEGAWNRTDLTIAPSSDYAQISTDRTNWSNSITLSTEDNPSTVGFYLKKADGTTTDKVNYTYKLDKTTPTGTISQGSNSWTKFLNTITFGLFFKETKNISISSEDTNGSGVALTGYYVLEVDNNKDSFEVTLEQAKAYTYQAGSSFDISPEKNVIVFAKIVDNAGNVTYINSQGLVLEETAPVISGITDGEIYYTTREITVKDTNFDKVTVNNEVFSGNTIAGDVDKTYIVVATDKAGNSTSYTVTMKTISSLSTAIDSLTTNNVKSSDKSVIESVKSAVSTVDIANASQVEKDKLKAIADKCDALLARISAIASDIQAVTTKLGDTTKANAKSSDSTRLTEAKAELERLLGTQNLTDAEKASLETKLTTTNEAIVAIAKVADEISAVTTKLGDTTKANAKSSDSTRLTEAKAELERLLGTQNLTDNEKSALEQMKTDVENAFAKIDEVTKAITDAKYPVKDITKDNVTKDDKTSLNKAAEDLQNVLDEYTDNLTDAEKEKIKDQIKSTQDIIKVLDDVTAVEDIIKSLPNQSDVTKDDADDVKKAEDDFNKLADHQKDLTDPAMVTKLIDVSNALKKLLLFDAPTGTKIEGIDGTEFDIRTELVVTPIKETLDKTTMKKFAISVTNAAKGQVIAQLYDVKLLLNGQPIQPDGKVKITLKLTDEQQNYKDLQVVYIADDGTVTIIPCEITGNEVSFITDHFSYYGIIGTPVKSSSGDETTPDTGDNIPVIPYITFAFLSAAALAITTKKRKFRVIKK